MGDGCWIGYPPPIKMKRWPPPLPGIFFFTLPKDFWPGSCMVWPSFSNIFHLPTGVVVSFMKAGFGGSIHPRKKRKRGWLPNGIIDSMTQKIALSCRSRYSRRGMYSSPSPLKSIFSFKNLLMLFSWCALFGYHYFFSFQYNG